MSTFDALAKARYVNLETFRKNGTGVQTPVMGRPRRRRDRHLHQRRLVQGEAATQEHVGAHCRVQRPRCAQRTMARWERAFVEDEAGKQSAIRALRKKYGWQMVLADWGGQIRGSKKNWKMIAVRLGGSE